MCVIVYIPVCSGTYPVGGWLWYLSCHLSCKKNPQINTFLLFPRLEAISLDNPRNVNNIALTIKLIENTLKHADTFNRKVMNLVCSFLQFIVPLYTYTSTSYCTQD